MLLSLKELILKYDLIGIDKNPFRIYLLFFWAIMQSAAVCLYYLHFKKFGYLPAPFLYDKSDTFMDLFNTLHAANDPGRYTVWQSVYPPINFLFLKLIGLVTSASDMKSAAILRAHGDKFIIFLLLSYFAIPLFVVRTRQYKMFSEIERLLLYVIFLTSPPMLFALERGNLIIFALVPFAMMVSASKKNRYYLLPILINIKPYFFIFLLGLIKNRQLLLISLITTSAIFFITLFLLNEVSLNFFSNIYQFAGSNKIFSLREVMSLPSSISAFGVLLRHPGFSEIWSMWGLSNNSMAIVVDAVRYFILILAFVLFVKLPPEMSDNKLILLSFSIVNLGISVGGYTMILIMAIFPLLIRTRLRHYYITLLIVYCAPWDFVSVASQNIGDMYAYLSDKSVIVEWSLGAGSIIRPIVTFGLLIIALIQCCNFPLTKLKNKYDNNLPPGVTP